MAVLTAVLASLTPCFFARYIRPTVNQSLPGMYLPTCETASTDTELNSEMCSSKPASRTFHVSPYTNIHTNITRKAETSTGMFRRISCHGILCQSRASRSPRK